MTDWELYMELRYEKKWPESLAISEVEYRLSDRAHELGIGVDKTTFMKEINTHTGTWDKNFLYGFYREEEANEFECIENW